MANNEYIPFSSEILEVIRHTAMEYTFRMQYDGPIRPGQFFEVSELPFNPELKCLLV